MADRDVQDSGGSSPEEGNGANLDALLKNAQALFEEGDLAGTIKSLQESIKRYPDSPLPHHNLSVVYISMLLEEETRKEVWEDLADEEACFEAAVRESEQAIGLDRGFVAAYNNLGMLFASRCWWAEAVAQWEMSLSIDPGQSKVRDEMMQARSHLD
jgi:tetratricopeptide (TPR) repeat protein